MQSPHEQNTPPVSCPHEIAIVEQKLVQTCESGGQHTHFETAVRWNSCQACCTESSQALHWHSCHLSSIHSLKAIDTLLNFQPFTNHVGPKDHVHDLLLDILVHTKSPVSKCTAPSTPSYEDRIFQLAAALAVFFSSVGPACRTRISKGMEDLSDDVTSRLDSSPDRIMNKTKQSKSMALAASCCC